MLFLTTHKQMDFTKLYRIEMEDLIPGNKYYIQKIKYKEEHPGTGQQYGIFDRFDVYENEIIYAVFRETYNFKNPTTNEILYSCMGTGTNEMYFHKKWFIFYEPRIVTFNRKQNELLAQVIEQITNDIHMAKYIRKQSWMDIVSSGK
jgi:hypothetical protein